MTLQELGREISRQREAQELSIDDLARRVKISARTLRAIEEGSLDSLPHAVYAKGFIRSYGLALRMDPLELNEYLDQVFPPEMFDDAKPEPGPLYRAEPSSSLFRRVAAVALLLLLTAGVIGGGWYIAANHAQTPLIWIKQLFSAGNGGALPSSNATGMDEAGGAPAVPTEEPGRTDSAAPPSEASREAVSSTDTPASTPVAETPRSHTPASETPAMPPAPEGNEMRITATANCWVGYRADGDQEVGYTVRVGETYTLTWKKTLSIRLGNPSGVSVTVNGQNYSFPYSSNKVAEFSLP